MKRIWIVAIQHGCLVTSSLIFNEVKCSLSELTTRSGCSQYCCQWFSYICTCVGFLTLLIAELIYQCGRKKEHFVWSVKWFFLPSPSAFHYLSVLWVPVFLGAWGSWLVWQVLPAIGAVLELDVSGTHPPLSDAVVKGWNQRSQSCTGTSGCYYLAQ